MSTRIDTTGLADVGAYRAAFDSHPTMVLDWERPACRQGWMDADSAKRDWISAQGKKTLEEVFQSSICEAAA